MESENWTFCWKPSPGLNTSITYRHGCGLNTTTQLSVGWLNMYTVPNADLNGYTGYHMLPVNASLLSQQTPPGHYYQLYQLIW